MVRLAFAFGTLEISVTKATLKSSASGVAALACLNYAIWIEVVFGIFFQEPRIEALVFLLICSKVPLHIWLIFKIT